MADGDMRYDGRGVRPSIEQDRAAARALVACYGEHDIRSLGWDRTDARGVHYAARAHEDEDIRLLLLPDEGALVTTRRPSGRWTFFVCPCGELLESVCDETGRDSRPSYPNEIARRPEDHGGPVVACSFCATRPTIPAAPPALMAS